MTGENLRFGFLSLFELHSLTHLLLTPWLVLVEKKSFWSLVLCLPLMLQTVIYFDYFIARYVVLHW